MTRLRVAVPAVPFNGWTIMLTAGGAHHEFGWPTHAPSYWLSLGVAALLNMVIALPPLAWWEED